MVPIKRAERSAFIVKRTTIGQEIRSLAEQYAGETPSISNSTIGNHIFKVTLCYGTGKNFYDVGRYFRVVGTFSTFMHFGRL